jgi:hypothetical protein
MPAAVLVIARALHRRRSLTGRLVTATTVVVLGPLLLLLLVLSGVQAAAPPGSTVPTPVARGPVPATLAASDLSEISAVPAALRPDFLAAARAYALPPALLAAVAEVESGFTPTAVGPPVAGGPAEGMMQFLPSSWTLFNLVPGATPFDPGPAVLAASRHLLSSGALPGGGFDAVAGLFGYNHSRPYGQHVLNVAAGYGYRYDATAPPDDPVRYHYPLALTTPADTAAGLTSASGAPAPLLLPTAPGTAVLACVRAAVVTAATPSATAAGALVLRGEDGFLYQYTGLSAMTPGLAPGVVLEPGAALGTSGTALGFGIRHDTSAGWVTAAAYLASWPQTASAAPALPARASA